MILTIDSENLPSIDNIGRELSLAGVKAPEVAYRTDCSTPTAQKILNGEANCKTAFSVVIELIILHQEHCS